MRVRSAVGRAAWVFAAVVLAAGCARTATANEPVTRAARVGPASGGTRAPGGQGECSARQLALGAVTRATGASTFGTTSLYFRQSVHDTGAACVLRWAGKIGVAATGKAFTTVKAENAGTTESVTIPAGGSRTIVLGAWWPITGTASSHTAKTWCATQVTGVSGVRLPVAAGGIVIGLGTRLPAVCPDPASMSVAIQG